MKEKRISLTNTDMFDALFHIMLTMAFDLPDILEYVEKHQNDSAFLEMIYCVHQTERIIPSTYVKRYNVLAPHFFDETLGHPGVNCFVMDCKSDASKICEKLLENLSLLEKTVACEGGCSPTTEQVFVLRVTLTHLMQLDSDFSSLEGDIGEVQQVKCSSQSCSRDVLSTISIKAPVLFIKTILDPEEQRNKIKLNQIPREIKLLNMEESFYLRGIINSEFGEGLSTDIQSQKLKKIINEKCFAYVLRNDSWMMIRSSEKTQFCRADKMVLPILFIYSQVVLN